MKAARLTLILLVAGLCLAARAQYPGRINKNTDTTPTLRATGIFEWTGDLDKPKAGRLIPLTVWDGTEYQPGGLYLAQPAPLTVLSGTVYELEQAGAPKGLFTINGAENLGGSWIAIGSVKPEVLKAKARPPMSKHPPQVIRDVDSDRPTLHKKDTSATSTSADSSVSTTQTTGGGAQSTSTSNPDQPTLHKRDSSAGGSGSSSDSSNSQSAPPVDSDRPTLHRNDSSGSAQPAPSVDPDRPTLHESQSNPGPYTGAPVTATDNTDPNRPKLRYGKPETPEGIVQPSKLEGMPVDMNQMAAISDVKTREPHTYLYSWADPEDAAKMKAAMEELAQKAIAENAAALAATTINATKPVTKSRTARHKAPPPPLPALADEQFKAYELAYNGGATLILTAKSGEGDAVKYVTLIAQPDFYGVPQIVFKQVTSEDRLDIMPRMRLVDAVDTDGDGRAELVFELRGKTSRAFAIYRVVNRQAEQAYNSGPLP